MPRFVIVINVQNFKMKSGDEIQQMGFYTTRRVENDNAEAAETVALDSVRREFSELVLNEKDDPPMLYVESICEVESFGNDHVPGKGATWYIENDENE